MKELKIEDGSSDKKYFTIIPNYILNHSTLYDREVYIQMKRISGENGSCWCSQKKLAKQCGMSVNRLKTSIKYLLEHDWIKVIGKKTIKTNGGNQEINEYKINDLWKLNTDFYLAQQGVSLNDTPIPKGVSRKQQRGITEKAKGVSQWVPNNNPVKEEPIKKITSAEPKRKDFIFKKELYDQILNEYQTIKGIKLQGKEFERPQQAIKTMFISKRSVEDIIGCIRWVATRDYIDWTLNTVAQKIPDYLKNKNVPRVFKAY